VQCLRHLGEVVALTDGFTHRTQLLKIHGLPFDASPALLVGLIIRKTIIE
jgi:hypothetical protein